MGCAIQQKAQDELIYIASMLAIGQDSRCRCSAYEFHRWLGRQNKVTDVTIGEDAIFVYTGKFVYKLNANSEYVNLASMQMGLLPMENEHTLPYQVVSATDLLDMIALSNKVGNSSLLLCLAKFLRLPVGNDLVIRDASLIEHLRSLEGLQISGVNGNTELRIEYCGNAYLWPFTEGSQSSAALQTLVKVVERG